MKINPALRLCASCILVLAWSASSLQAALNAFTNTAGGSWETAGNWSSGTTPVNTDGIFITNMAPYTVYITNSTANTDPGGATSWMTVSNLVVGASNNLTGLVIDFTNAARTLVVSNITIVGDQIAQRGTLTISNGAFNTSSMILGNNARSQGTLNIAGGTIMIRGNAGLVLALNNIASTGSVVMTGGQLIATNSNPTSGIGSIGRGVFTLNNGLFINKNLNIGANSFGTGEFYIFGGTNISFGQGATGGGAAFRLGVVGSPNTSRGTVFLDGGTVIVTNGYTQIGVAGQGTFYHSNGTFVAETVLVGTNITAAARGEWRISGSGSTSIVKGPMWIGGTTLTPAGTGIVSVVGSPTLDWRSNITLQAGGRLSFSNYVGNIGNGGVVTNQGRIDVVNSKVTYGKTFVLSGAYVSDPSTNTFAANLTVTPSGYLQGGVGDLFDFKQNLIINSTNSSLFDLASSTVSFSGSNGSHTNAVAGEDFGPGMAPGDKPFSYHNLTLATASDEVFFTNGVSVATSNALYVWQLDLPNSDTNYVANLHSSFNIYYVTSNAAPQNAYLNDMTYALDGGGFLLPAIPESSTLTLLALAGLALIRSRYRS